MIVLISIFTRGCAVPRTSRIVTIPKPAPGSFNKRRAAGELLRAQTIHLREGLINHVAELAKRLEEAAGILALDMRSIKTEGDVSDYAKKVTAILHPRGSRPQAK
jgi:hypothetical protein